MPPVGAQRRCALGHNTLCPYNWFVIRDSPFPRRKIRIKIRNENDYNENRHSRSYWEGKNDENHETLIAFLLLAFTLASCVFPTKVPTLIPVTPVPPTATTPAGLTDYSSGAYLDDRSTPAALVLSYVNAINSHHFVRAYSYYEAPSIFPGSYPFYETGLADTDVITSAVFGPVNSDAGAGQYYYQVPVAEYITETDASEHLYIGCYNLHLANPSFQGTLPFRPMAITTEEMTEYLITVDVTPILAAICSPYPTSTPHPTATWTPAPVSVDPCKQYNIEQCKDNERVCYWTGTVCKSR